ncbi:MAG: hypothetical protein IT582_08005, partial [Opitutaceae bacterium]|nr:hypothetical protein [Opitutaceae bacterium]
MPAAVIPAVLAAGAAYSAGALTIFGVSIATTAWGAAIYAGLGSLALSFATGALSGKPKTPQLPNFNVEARDRIQSFRSPVAPHRIVYGRARIGGPLAFSASTGTTHEYLHIVTPIAAHEVAGFDDFILGDTPVGPLDGSGNATMGVFNGFARIKTHVGTDTQAADTDLISEVTEWNEDRQGLGIAYAYIRAKFSDDVYPQGFPNFSAVVRGRKIYDPRDLSTGWSDNWALVVRDFLTASFGLGATDDEIDDTTFSAAANVCDEYVSVTAESATCTADTGTDEITVLRSQFKHALKTGDRVTWNSNTRYAIALRDTADGDHIIKVATSLANARAGTATTVGSASATLATDAQLRYTANGSFTLDKTPIDTMQDLLTAGAGVLVYEQGKYKLFAGASATATVTLTRDHLRKDISIRPRKQRRDLYNGVRGTYVEPGAYWQVADFPPLTNSTYETQDGAVRIMRDIELPYTVDSRAAQRIAKIHLEQSRQGITIEFPANFAALQVSVWDVVNVTLSEFGWTAKEFRVLGWVLAEGGGIDLVLQEHAAATYDWAAGDATDYDPAPDTELPSAFDAEPPTGLTLSSGTDELLTLGEGSVLSRIKATWTAPTRGFVAQYEIQSKPTAESEWNSQIVSGSNLVAWVAPVEDAASYDVRVRSITMTGVRSSWELVAGHIVVGKTETPPAPNTLTVQRLADGTRRFAWSLADVPSDVRSGGGYRIRWYLGTTSDWSAMTALHDGLLVSSPYETNELAAGTYTFAIKTVDSTGNESADARFATSVTLGDPRLKSVIYQQIEENLPWTGTLTNCFIDGDNVLRATSSQAWSDLAGAWSSLAGTWEGLLTNNSPMTYETDEIDLGADFSFTPLISTVADGTVTITVKTGSTADGSVVGSYAAPAFVTGKRYLKVKVEVAGTTPELFSLITLADGESVTEEYEDVNTATETATWFASTAAGHFKSGSRDGDIATIALAR